MGSRKSILNHKKDAAQTGVFAGLVTALCIGPVETILAITKMDASGASVLGILLAPFFYWAVLLPAGAVIGGALGLLQSCWHEYDTLALKKISKSGVASFSQGSLTALGWFWGSLLTVGVVAIAGTVLSLYFDEIFHNRLLAGLLLTLMIGVVGVVISGLVRRSMLLTGALIVKLRGDTPGGWLSSKSLAIASGVLVAAGLGIVVYTSAATLTAIGIPQILWLSALPLVMLLAFIVTVAVASRWQLWPRIRVWLVALPVVGLIVALGLGEIDAVRQAALVSETPAAELTTFYRALSDVDGDGATGFFGGPDCAPFDSMVGPHAKEIPGNGIDDNCVAGDATDAVNASDHELENAKAFSPLPDGFPKNPNLVLIVVDALRADHMKLYGYHRNTTPGIDRYAQKGVVFDRAYSQGTGTISSMPSLFTGKYSYQLKYIDDRMPPAISPDETTLAEHLKAAGYTTLGVTQIAYTRNGRWRLLQGFDDVDKTLAHTKPKPDRRITSPETLELALAMLERAKRAKKPYFLWVHFYDVHGNYLPHKELESFGKNRVDKYDTEILYSDGYITKFLDVVLGPNQPPTVVVLAADHGDGFRVDRGYTSHAYGLFEELIHVPLIVWSPGVKPRRVDTPVGNIDITPTLINTAGIVKPFLRGHSLFPYLYDGYRNPDRLVFSEKTFGRGKRKRYRKSATGMRWKMRRWITEKKEFLHDLKNDPGEKHNVIKKYPKQAKRLRKQIDLFLERNAIDTLEMEQGKVK